jgi:serine/threonine-protein kinase HipA
VALTLARAAGVRVPRFSLHKIDGKSVLVSRRFDRDRQERIGYVSAMTMLEATERQQGSYLEIAEAIERYSQAPSADLQELWRRIAFSRLISNTDDHLRNHGFLRTSAAGWSLSPAFDLNPNPQPGTPFSTVIDHGQAENGIEGALALADLFRLTPAEVDRTLAEVRGATSQWRKVATGTGLSPAEIERMSPAFEPGLTS